MAKSITIETLTIPSSKIEYIVIHSKTLIEFQSIKLFPSAKSPTTKKGHEKKNLREKKSNLKVKNRHFK